jgi:hypothetical protein
MSRGEGLCEFCCEEKEFTASTTFHSNYCANCTRLVIEECQKALREIRAAKQKVKGNRRKPA